MKARELQVGDRLLAEDGQIEIIRQIGKGMIYYRSTSDEPNRRAIGVTYRSGRWSELDPEQDVEILE